MEFSESHVFLRIPLIISKTVLFSKISKLPNVSRLSLLSICGLLLGGPTNSVPTRGHQSSKSRFSGKLFLSINLKILKLGKLF